MTIDRFAILISTMFFLSLLSCSTFAQIGSSPGAYSRMGFGSRGIGMGNAFIAMTTGDITGYYNPAAVPFSKVRSGLLSFGLLDLDRSLNFLGYTQSLRGTAGISAGIINSGVSDIDGRDGDGEQTGPLRTSENQIFLSFGTQIKPQLGIGVTIKFLHSHLYTDVTSTTVGIDFGAIYVVDDDISVGLVVKDINSKYAWDTAPIYGQNGGTREDEFPLRFGAGGTWKLPDSIGIFSVDVEATNKKTIQMRAGLEVPIIPEVVVRAGIDRIDLKESGAGVKPSIGFSIQRDIGDWVPSIHYVFVLEPFTNSGIHVISLSANF